MFLSTYQRLFPAGGKIRIFIACILLVSVIGCTGKKAVFRADLYDEVGRQMARIKNRKDLTAALYYADSMRRSNPADSVTVRLARQDFLRDLMEYRRKYGESLHYADSVIASLETEMEVTESRQKLLVTMYRRKAALLGLSHDYETAVDFFNRSLSLLEELTDSCFAGEQQVNINRDFANIKLKTRNFREAAWYYRKALESYPSCLTDDRVAYERQTLESNIGQAYSDAGEPDSAMMAYQRALRELTDFEEKYPEKGKGIKVAKGVVLGNAAGIFVKRGDLDTATALFQRSIVLSQDGAPEIALFARVRLIDAYTRMGNLLTAGTLLKATSESLDTLQSPAGTREFYPIAARYFDRAGQSGRALMYLKKYNAILEKEGTERNEDSDLIQSLRLSVTEGKLKLLEQKSSIQTLYLFLAAGGIVTAILVVLLVWLYSRRLKSRNAQISSVNRQLEVTLSGLHESNRRYGRMVQVIAHDLKNPLKVIDQFCRTNVSVDAAEAPEMLQAISETARESMAIIDNILLYERHVQVIDRKPTDLYAVLVPCIRLMQQQASAKDQHIALEGDSDAWCLINADSIWRVMLNLLGNAIKFSYHGGEIQVMITSDASVVQVTVEDHGIGIPPDRLDDVFDFHTSLARAGTDGEDSNGMGLSICRRIIELHDGEIWAESDPETGTSFCFTLPGSPRSASGNSN